MDLGQKSLLLLSIVILLGIGYAYEKWKSHDKENKNLVDDDLVKK